MSNASYKNNELEKFYNEIEKKLEEKFGFFIRDLNEKISEDVKYVFGMRDFYRFGTRYIGLKTFYKDYLNKKGDTLLEETEGENKDSVGSEKFCQYICNEKRNLEQVINDLQSKIFAFAIALKEKENNIKNFRKEIFERYEKLLSEEDIKSLYDEFLIFPFPHMYLISLITWGTHKFSLVFYYPDNVNLNEIKKGIKMYLTSCASVISRFERNIFEYSFFTLTQPPYEFEPELAILYSIKFILRPLVTILVKPEKGNLECIIEKWEYDDNEKCWKYKCVGCADSLGKELKKIIEETNLENSEVFWKGELFNLNEKGTKSEIIRKIFHLESNNEEKPILYKESGLMLLGINLKKFELSSKDSYIFIFPYYLNPEHEIAGKSFKSQELKKKFEKYYKFLNNEILNLLDSIKYTWGWSSILYKQIYHSASISILAHAYNHDIGGHGLRGVIKDLEELEKNLGSKPIKDPATIKEYKETFEYLVSKGEFWVRSIETKGGTYPALVSLNSIYEECMMAEKLYKNIVRSELGEPSGKFKLVIKKDDKELSKEEQEKICFYSPYGETIMKQAISTMIETILRNLKHYLAGKDLENLNNKDKKEILEGRKESLKDEIKFEIKINKKEDFYELSLSDCQLYLSNKFLEDLKKGLEERKLISETGEIKTGGTNEIIICSALCRGIPYDLIKKKWEPELVKVDLENISCNSIKKDWNPELVKRISQLQKKCYKLLYKLYLYKGEDSLMVKGKEDLSKVEKAEFVFCEDEEIFKKIPKIKKALIKENKKDKEDIWILNKSDKKYSEIYKEWVKWWINEDVKIINDQDTLKIQIGNNNFIIEHAELDFNNPSLIAFTSGDHPRNWFREECYEYGIIESIFTKIIFFDGRIHNYKRDWEIECNKNYVEKFLEKVNFVILNPESQYNQLNELIKTALPTFLIIHTSDIERISGNNPVEYMKNILNNIKEDIRKYVIFTTAKKFPEWVDNLSEEYPFKIMCLPFNDIDGIFKSSPTSSRFTSKRNSFILWIKKSLIKRISFLVLKGGKENE